ncbi:YfcE family phosphodiesterase [Lapidilactobacillus luobeiensis]|uniref:YfcE family phosphodiesterase n=1 Tax=Lapidilactobacillus luobeiensis TaxID=2950371 RepID=UPI0021C40F7E|nr:YfcE family phosphodiesterase [Lapidilactobacillus luobeiensis]
MTQILVVSDSHGDDAILAKLVAHYRDQVALMVHCGDSELSFQDRLRSQFLIVGGNMDFDPDFPATASATLGSERIFVAHGHRLGVNYDLLQFQLAAQAQQATMAFYGHTHQLGCVLTAGMLILNPGSISQPRGKWTRLGGTYALVTATPERFTVQYYDRAFQPVPELQWTFDR